MNEIFVYVEGPSDQLGMRELLCDIMEHAASRGNKLDFYPLNGKKPLLIKGPKKAINILRNKPNSSVFLVPDLYPRNLPFPHSSYNELKIELEKRFKDELRSKNCDIRLSERFFVHCFKYDLEALVLASGDALLKRLGKEKFSQSWANPVEYQNHDKPPKRIVEALFQDAGMRYKDTADVPWILQRSSYGELIKSCSQNFKPFIEDLFRILGVQIA